MKRFTETTKWQDPWFSELTAEQKVLWLYLCDNCDNSGVINFSERIASFLINGVEKLDLDPLKDRLQFLPNGKILITNFISFQYGNELKETSNLHRSVLQLMKSNELKEENFKGSLRVPEGYLKTPGKGKGIGIGKGKGSEMPRNEKLFNEFYEKYPLKKSKQEAFKSFCKILKNKTATHEQIIQGVENLNTAISQGKQDPNFVKHPSTWLNQGCWDDTYENTNRGIGIVPQATRSNLLQEILNRKDD